MPKEEDKELTQAAEKVRKLADTLGYQIVAYLVFDQGGIVPNATLVPKQQDVSKHPANAGSGGATDGGQPDTQEVQKPVRDSGQPASSDTKKDS